MSKCACGRPKSYYQPPQPEGRISMGSTPIALLTDEELERLKAWADNHDFSGCLMPKEVTLADQRGVDPAEDRFISRMVRKAHEEQVRKERSRPHRDRR